MYARAVGKGVRVYEIQRQITLPDDVQLQNGMCIQFNHDTDLEDGDRYVYTIAIHQIAFYEIEVYATKKSLNAASIEADGGESGNIVDVCTIVKLRESGLPTRVVLLQTTITSRGFVCLHIYKFSNGSTELSLGLGSHANFLHMDSFMHKIAVKDISCWVSYNSDSNLTFIPCDLTVTCDGKNSHF